MVRHLVVLFGLVYFTLLTYVNIRVKVLARRGVVVPARALLLVWRFLDSDLLFEVINAGFVLVRLLLVICRALLGRDWAFALLCLLFQIFLLSGASLSWIADSERCGLLASKNACIVYIHVESKLLLLESDLLLCGKADCGFLPVPGFILIFPRISFSHNTVEIQIMAPVQIHVLRFKFTLVNKSKRSFNLLELAWFTCRIFLYTMDNFATTIEKWVVALLYLAAKT